MFININCTYLTLFWAKWSYYLLSYYDIFVVNKRKKTHCIRSLAQVVLVFRSLMRRGTAAFAELASKGIIAKLTSTTVPKILVWIPLPVLTMSTRSDASASPASWGPFARRTSTTASRCPVPTAAHARTPSTTTSALVPLVGNRNAKMMLKYVHVVLCLRNEDD